MKKIKFFDKIKNLFAKEEEKQDTCNFDATQITSIKDQIKTEFHKLHLKQKELSLQLEDIDNFLQDRDHDLDSDMPFVNTLIEVADYIENFYIFLSSDKSSHLFTQVEMMLDSVLDKLNALNITQICCEDSEYNFKYHTILQTESDSEILDNHIISTIKSGYMYGDKIIRKSLVIVNKRRS